MNVTQTPLQDVLVIEPRVFPDSRGHFMETYSEKRYADCGISCRFVQDNLSVSCRGTLRGLHYQLPNGQAKLVQVVKGTVLDVVADIRIGSPTFGKTFTVELSDENNRQCFIPAGLAHGFCVLSKESIFLYKCSDFYSPESEKGVLWCDKDLNIQWQLEKPLLSDKDSKLPRLKEIPEDQLPVYTP